MICLPLFVYLHGFYHPSIGAPVGPLLCACVSRAPPNPIASWVVAPEPIPPSCSWPGFGGRCPPTSGGAAAAVERHAGIMTV